MIGLLRFVGLTNAAVWLGAAVYFTFGVAPAVQSPETRELLGTSYFPYFSGAVWNIVLSRYWALHTVCGVVALGHLASEWLYLGRRPGRWLTGLLAALLLAGLAGGFWAGPRMARLHTAAHAVNLRPAQRERAAASLAAWRAVYNVTNYLVLGALAFYLWRVGNPPDPARFVSASKFRG